MGLCREKLRDTDSLHGPLSVQMLYSLLLDQAGQIQGAKAEIQVEKQNLQMCHQI